MKRPITRDLIWSNFLRNRYWFATIFMMCFATGCTTSTENKSAENIARHAMKMMGGEQALADIRYLRFDFVVDVNGNTVYSGQHLWDRQSGRYRQEWDLFGEQAQALFNTNTQVGRVFRDGQEMSGEDGAELMEQALYNYMNDSYWLLMPWKLLDPGVHLSSLGTEETGGKTYNILHVSFDLGTGNSPGDQHWLFIDRESGIVDHSAYYLERFEKDNPNLEEATRWAWGDWTQVEGVKFAKDRRVTRTVLDPFETARARFTFIKSLAEVDDQVFESLDIPMPE